MSVRKSILILCGAIVGAVAFAQSTPPAEIVVPSELVEPRAVAVAASREHDRAAYARIEQLTAEIEQLRAQLAAEQAARVKAQKERAAAVKAVADAKAALEAFAEKP